MLSRHTVISPALPWLIPSDRSLEGPRVNFPFLIITFHEYKELTKHTPLPPPPHILILLDLSFVCQIVPFPLTFPQRSYSLTFASFALIISGTFPKSLPFSCHLLGAG